MDDIRELSERLHRIEKRHRRSQFVLVLLAVGASAVMLMGQAGAPQRSKPDTPSPISSDGKIRGEAFILVDSKGNERASLVTDAAGGVFLVLFDKDGKARADMQVNNYGPSLNFYDPNAKTRLVIGSTPLVASHVSNKGVIEKNTPSSIVLFDSLGGLVWRNP